jgi:acid phosphatase
MDLRSSSYRRRLAVLLAGVASLSAALLAAAPPSPAATGTTTKVLTIIEENHSFDEMRAGMPYLNSLANQYGYATDYNAVAHPSLPNYLAIAGGSTFGVTTNGLPVTSTGAPSPNAQKVGLAQSVFGEALANGETAKTYAEGMASNCQLVNGGVKYVARHNPWTYFQSERSNCNLLDVPMVDTAGVDQLKADAAAGTLPNAGMLIPNVCDDAHNCSLTRADNWLKGVLPSLMSGPDFTSGSLTIVVTADETDLDTGPNVVETVVLHAGMTPTVVSSYLDHYALSGYYSHVLGVPLLGQATDTFASAFGL